MKNKRSGKPDKASPPAQSKAGTKRADEKQKNNRPTVRQLEAEIERDDQQRRFSRALRSTVFVLVMVAAAVVLLSTLLFPVLKIYGKSMTPTLNEGQIVVALKGSDFKTGDIIAFYYNNKILVKRVICGAGDWVNLARSGPGLPGTDAAFDRGGAACLGLPDEKVERAPWEIEAQPDSSVWRWASSA